MSDPLEAEPITERLRRASDIESCPTLLVEAAAYIDVLQLSKERIHRRAQQAETVVAAARATHHRAHGSGSPYSPGPTPTPLAECASEICRALTILDNEKEQTR